jgi:hypothetical protein
MTDETKIIRTKERLFDYKFDEFSVQNKTKLKEDIYKPGGEIVVLVIENIIYLRTKSYSHAEILNGAKGRRTKEPINSEDFSRTAVSVFKKYKGEYIMDFSAIADDFRGDYIEEEVRLKIMEFFDL